MYSRLRPYQSKIALAVLPSVSEAASQTFSVEISRQGGKNEVSAWIEIFTMALSHSGLS